VVFLLALGGWAAGKDQDSWPQVPLFSDAGVSVVTTETFDIGRGGDIPRIVQGLRCTITLVRSLAKQHPEWNVSTDRVGMAGLSAGGHIAEYFAATGGVATAFAWDGPTDLPKFWQETAARSDNDGDEPSGKMVLFLLALGFHGIPGFSLSSYDAFSPAKLVNEHSSPLAIIHGTLDKTVALDQSEELVARYQAAGVPVELSTLAVNHSAQGPDSGKWWQLSKSVVTRHFQRYLVEIAHP
jgi:acetyl esterase/lipase